MSWFQNVILSEEFHSKKFKHHPRTFSCHSEIIPTHKVTEELLSPKAFVDFVVMFSCEESVMKKKSDSSTLLPEIGAGGNKLYISTKRRLWFIQYYNERLKTEVLL